MSDVPSDAAAVDVPCPHCGERPIEQAAKAYGVAGFLIAYRLSRRTHVGCGTCTRRKCWGSAAKTAVTGWWSITCIIINPFLIVWNLLRGLVNRGPTAGLVSLLEESGVSVSYLADPAEFEPGGHVDDELLVNGLAQLGCAVMLADEDAGEAEAALIRDELAGLAPDRSTAELETLIEETVQTRPEVEDVADALGNLLSLEGRDAALGLATRVAAADGDIDDREVSMIEELAAALGMDVSAEEVAALAEMNLAMAEAE